MLLSDDDLQSVQPADWKALVGLRSRSASDVRELFYPGAPLEENSEVDGSLHRRPKFLGALDDAAYFNACQAVLEFSDRRLPDIQTMLGTGRRDGKAVSQLMCHVVKWLNPSPTKVGDRENNKPPLWRDLMWPFNAGSSSSKAETEGQAQELQRRIFDVVRDRVAELSDLSTMPDTGGDSSYLERFDTPIWKDILVAVHSMVGPRFQGVMAKFNQQDPTTLSSRQESTLVSAISKTIRQIPEIKQNPALRSSKALDGIMAKISPIILAWASEQCTEALRVQKLGQAPPWPPSVLKSVTSELENLNSLLPQLSPARRTLPRTKPTAARPGSSQNHLDHWRSSPPIIQQAEELQVQSPIASESGTISDGPDNAALPPLVSSTAIDLEIDEAELHRRRRIQRQTSGRASLSQSRTRAPDQATPALPVLEVPKEVSSTAPPLLSRGKRSWKDRPAAQPKLHAFASDRGLLLRQRKSHPRPLEAETTIGSD
jgi:hypothetical protein